MQNIILSEEFYKDVQNELMKYANNYDIIMERSAILEQIEQQRMERQEVSNAILEKFGAIS